MNEPIASVGFGQLLPMRPAAAYFLLVMNFEAVSCSGDCGQCLYVNFCFYV